MRLLYDCQANLGVNFFTFANQVPPYLMLKQSQHQKLSLKLSPSQIQIMKLLQVPTVNLEERIKEELEDNPALELGSDHSDDDAYGLDTPDEEKDDSDLSSDDTEQIDLNDFLKHEDDYSGGGTYSGDDNDTDRGTIPIQLETTLHDYLMDQLGMLDLEEREHQVAEQIIGSIDDDGYLRREIPAIVDDLAFARNIMTTAAEVTDIINKIREFDPPGIAAWTLKECLVLQLQRMDQTPEVKQAKVILDTYYDEFIKKNYDKIQRQLNMDAADFKKVIRTIIKLTPKPGAAFGSAGTAKTYIVPDFFVYNNNGVLDLTINAKNAPELRVSEGYMDMMKAYERGDKKNKRQRETVHFIKQKLDAAKWFIDALKQRQETLLFTMHAILNIQKAFFLTGDEANLRPMILKDIANVTGLDVSTISRVANSKFVQTEFGTFKLKSFFSESIQNESGEEVSTREVKSILNDFVKNEDKNEPLSDDMLKDLLQQKGYHIARRTIAKYREMLHIPVARLRRVL